jgi:dGTPase
MPRDRIRNRVPNNTVEQGRAHQVTKYINRMDPEREETIQTDIRKREDAYLSPNASRSEEGERRKPNSRDDVRTRYSRDADRIIHTHAFSRYIDKTQVFFSVDNDHITHRVLHVQMVSKIGRTIGRALRLNDDLIEAIALGHDIGHVPYGHIGERSLSRICKEHGIGQFHHNIESVHMLQDIEDCNLTLQVVDGIFTHNGEVHVQQLAPERNRTWESLDDDILRIMRGEMDKPPSPMTLEGCVVRFSDVIAYLGRDIEDALELGLIEGTEEIPEGCKERIGTTNADIINSLIIDLIENSYCEDHIAFSREVSDLVQDYRRFNNERIYIPVARKAGEVRIGRMFDIQFETFLHDLEEDNRGSDIFPNFVDCTWIDPAYMASSSHPVKVRDHLAGMTDRYFNDMFERIVMPRRVTTFKGERVGRPRKYEGGK